MRATAIRLLLLVATVALFSAPGTSQAARIGTNLADHSVTAINNCPTMPFCTVAQTKVAGQAMRAPFSGKITKWRVTQPNGTLWLQVLRRHHNGSFESLRSGDPEVLVSNPGQTLSLSTHLQIHKGDFVGVGLDDFYSSSLGVDDSVGSAYCQKGFVPGLGDGESGFPPPGYSACGALLLYNATLVH